MGGHGSGRPGVRTAVEDALRLDLASPAVRNVIRSGCWGSGRWTWSCDGDRMATVGYALETIDETGVQLTLAYSVDGVQVRQAVPLVQSRPNFGGRRWWFLCPVLFERGERRPARALFLPNGARYFGCRQAHRLNYRSQKESRNTLQAIERLLRKFG